MEKIYELIIIGGGPAGSAASVYAGRKRLNTLMILGEWGGQSVVSDDIQNWIGTAHLSGNDLKENLKNHVETYKGNNLEIKENTFVQNIYKKEDNIFKVETSTGEIFLSKSILITTGSKRKTLDIKGAAEFENKGLTYCASCDGPLFADMDVVVIGGGNSAFETSIQLLAYCKSVTQLVRNKTRADELVIEKALANPKFKLLLGAVPEEVHGETFVNAITYSDKDTGEKTKLNTSAVFIEVGHTPITDFAKELCNLNELGNIQVDPMTQTTSQSGIWAAGDCTDGLYHQNNIAVGDAVKAIEDIFKYLR